MINAASSRLQSNQVIEKQKYLFHRDPPCFENKRSAQQDWKWKKKWLDIYDVDVHSNAPVSQSKAAILFSLFEPSGFFTLQLSLSWRHSRSSLGMASFLSTTSIASLTCFWRPQQGSRIDIGERGDWPVSVGEDRQNSIDIALETAEHHQPLLNDLLAVSLVTGKRKMWRKLSVGRTWKRAKRLLAWQGSRWRRAQTRMSPTSLSEQTETWCSLIADSLAQNKPVVSIRHHNKETKERSKDNQTDSCNFGRKDSSAAASHLRQDPPPLRLF